jgi:hypothetical protein
MMIRSFSFIALFVILQPTSFAQGHEIIEGEFEFNKILNEPYSGDTQVRDEFEKTLQSLDIKKTEDYIGKMVAANYESAEKIKNSDPWLRSIPERAVFIFYSLHHVHKSGLLFNPSITLVSGDLNDGTKNIYLTDNQFKDMEQRKNKKKLKLEVQFVREAELTKFKIYKLVRMLE